jgi:hypothetical protein
MADTDPEVYKKQHAMMFRKLLLRRHLLRWAISGPVYVPFCGDGDIAVELYADREVFGADLDGERVENAQSRLHGDFRVQDVAIWPFPDVDEAFAVADFDAYGDPYPAFRAFWQNAEKEDTLVCFFTDGRRLELQRSGKRHIDWKKPDGSSQLLTDWPSKAPIANAYLERHVWPWFYEYVKPFRVLERWRYQRSAIIYWGAALQRP